MRSIFFLLVLFIFSFNSVLSQVNHDHVHPCNTVKMTQELFKKRPGLEKKVLAYDAQTENENATMRSGSLIQIPIVFHVIHNWGPENISDEQIYNAVDVLNEQMRLQNANASLIKDEFVALAADTEIEFVLARKDPQGNCTKGINRIASIQTYDGDQDMKELIQWPRDSYLNIWVCADAAGAAGYTYRPISVDGWPAGDGIVLRHDYTGAIGTSSVTRSTALTHEVGHWINLAHVWGNTNSAGVECGNDGVNDTPITEGWTSCNVNGETCGSLDNVENYMEYSFCSKMFTEGQKTRMRNALNSGIADRDELWTNSNLIATGVIDGETLCEISLEADYTTICFGDSAYFHDQSFHGVQSRLWEFPGGTPATSEEENPVVYYSEPGQKNVTLTVFDGSNSISETFNSFITVLPNEGEQLPFIDGFENGENQFNNDWEVVNLDQTFGWEYNANTAANGSASIWINNRYNDADQIDEIISEPIDIEDFEEVTVSFKYAYAERSTSNNEKLRMYISKDCGQIWSLRKSVQGNNFSTNGEVTNSNWFPQDNEWAEVSTSNILENYFVSNLLIKFRFESDGGNNIFLDDINVFDPLVGLTEVLDEHYKLRVFPNPSSDFYTITFQLENIESINWKVREITGKLVSEGVYNNPEMGKNRMQIKNAEWTPGIYLFELYTEKGVIAQKLIKQ